MTAKESREVLSKAKTAFESACDYFRAAEDYPVITLKYTPEQRQAIAEFLSAFFEFDESGRISGLCDSTVKLFSNIKEFKNVK